jgi:arginine decarboxylase
LNKRKEAREAKAAKEAKEAKESKRHKEGHWALEDSTDLYHVKGWGEPYFSISGKGRIEVQPNPDADARIDLYNLVHDLQARGLDLPLLIRFSDILAHRIRHINRCFEKAIEEYGYPGVYRGVYPVKVNQQRHLVEEVVEFGTPWRFGLEAGSKPELLIALAAMQDAGGFIICNGYKDLKYIETALVAQQFDKTVVVVLERIEELDLALRASQKTGIKPILGVRAKLSAKGVGRWKSTTSTRRTCSGVSSSCTSTSGARSARSSRSRTRCARRPTSTSSSPRWAAT